MKASDTLARILHASHHAAQRPTIVQVDLKSLREIFAEARRPPPPALLDVHKLCDQLMVSPSTIKRLCREGLPFLIVGATRRFELAAVLEWLRCRVPDPENSISPTGGGTPE